MSLTGDTGHAGAVGLAAACVTNLAWSLAPPPRSLTSAWRP
jgi:hypothetical protein